MEGLCPAEPPHHWHRARWAGCHGCHPRRAPRRVPVFTLTMGQGANGWHSKGPSPLAGWLEGQRPSNLLLPLRAPANCASGMRGISTPVGRACIPPAAMHAPDQPHLRRIEIEARCILHAIVTHMHRDDTPHDDGVVPGRHELENLAFQRDRVSSAMRGTFTTEDGAVVRPASASSSTPWGKSMAVMFICAAFSAETRFTTNCPVASIFASASFTTPGGRRSQPMPTTTGLLEHIEE